MPSPPEADGLGYELLECCNKVSYFKDYFKYFITNPKIDFDFWGKVWHRSIAGKLDVVISGLLF
jgi:hypothetical protein